MRQKLSKKLRFEVLKRDRFKCKYCGKGAEETLLHVDHVVPVAKGGDNDLMNLVTACEACNLGKKDIPLDDASTAQAARRQAELLHEQKEILEMMAQWRAGLRDIKQQSVDLLADHWSASATGFILNENAKAELKRMLKKYSYEELTEAIDRAVEQYVVFNENGQATSESAEIAFDKIKSIAKWQKVFKEDPTLEKLIYIRGIARKRCPRYFPEREALALLKEARDAGVDLEDLKEIAIAAQNYTSFSNAVTAAIEEVDKNQSEEPSKQESATVEDTMRWSTEEGSHHYGGTLATSERLIKNQTFKEIREEKVWVCDTCAEVIEDDSDGKLVRYWMGDKAKLCIVHSSDEDCNKSKHFEEVGSLSRYTKGDAVMEFASLFQCGDFITRSVSETMKRCLVPGYELAHYHFAWALKEKVVAPYLSDGCFYDFQLDRILAWLGAKGACLKAPDGSFESNRPFPDPRDGSESEAYEIEDFLALNKWDTEEAYWQDIDRWKLMTDAVIPDLVRSTSIKDLMTKREWICDRCCKPLTDPDNAFLTVHYTKNGKAELGIAHIGNQCASESVVKERNFYAAAPLRKLAPPADPGHIAAMLLEKSYPVEEIAEILRRFFVPGYEFIRWHLKLALREQVIWLEESETPEPWQTERVLAWLGAQGDPIPAPEGSPESKVMNLNHRYQHEVASEQRP